MLFDEIFKLEYINTDISIDFKHTSNKCQHGGFF